MHPEPSVVRLAPRDHSGDLPADTAAGNGAGSQRVDPPRVRPSPRPRRRVQVDAFDPEQRRVKSGFATRRVPPRVMQTLVSGKVRPRSGDLVLARVTRLGQHSRIEHPNGRRARLHIGDEVLVAYADRYAPDQFESEVPTDLGPTQLVAAGGIASAMLTRSGSVRNATDIVPVGLVGDGRGRPLNVADFGLTPVVPAHERPPTIAVIGTSMNAGKTTTIRWLVHGLSRAGARPGTTKVTGTGSGGDYWVMLDAGSHVTLDFTDVGLASTYRQPLAKIESAFVQLTDHLTAAGSGVALVEVADGIYQRETAWLIASETFRSAVDAVIFAAGDAGGAAAGVDHLRRQGLNVVALSGLITRSPLSVREAERVTGLPALSVDALVRTDVLSELIGVDLTARPTEEATQSRAASGGHTGAGQAEVARTQDAATQEGLSEAPEPDDSADASESEPVAPRDHVVTDESAPASADREHREAV